MHIVGVPEIMMAAVWWPSAKLRNAAKKWDETKPRLAEWMRTRADRLDSGEISRGS